MKKKSVLFVCLLAFAETVMAQTSLTVTLSNDSATVEFYGQDAFKTAVAAASDGNLITLSAGTFHGTTVNKSLTIRGNGVEPAQSATFIDTETILEKSENPDNRWLKIEGISFLGNLNIMCPNKQNTDLNELKDLTMVKCDINDFSSKEYYPYGAYYGTLGNSTFIQCRIKNSFTIWNVSEVAFVNSIVCNLRWKNGTGDQPNDPKINFLNSVSVFNDCPRNIGYVNAINSIMVVTATKVKGGWQEKEHYYEFPSSVNLKNTVITGYLVDTTHVSDMYININPVETQWKPMEEVFSTLTNYTAFVGSDDYSLTEQAKAIPGTDGTETGIYGGAAPYTNIVSYPRFTQFEVSDKAVDGKISVNLTIE